LTDYADICNELYRLARECNGRNVDITLNEVPVLLIQRHEDADHVLRANSGNYRKNMAWFRQALGASRFSEEGEAWQVRRALTHAYFTHFDREQACALARRHAGVAVQRLRSDSEGGAATIDDGVLRRLTASVLVENFLGVPYERTGLDMQRIAELMEYGSAYSFVPAGETRRLYLDGLRQLPALRRAVLQELHCFRDGSVPAGPLLRDLLAADQDPQQDIVLEHELVTFFAAGAETSAATLGWAAYLLALYPEVQAQLRAHVARMAGEHPDWGWRELSSLDALADFVSETLRLFPPTPIVARLAVEADTIGSHAIGPGHNVIISFVGVQHDARHRPEPWLLHADGSARKGIASGVNTAFSFGPRVCGGKHFALVELMAALAVFLLQARFELTSDAPPRFHWKAQMLREGGQPVRVVGLEGARPGR